jgi:hypothetical protein
MGTLVLAGATSGSTTLTPTDAVTATITMPSATGALVTQLASTYTATLTGCTTAPTYTVTYSLTGNQVTINVPFVTATSNTTAKTLTGMPAALWPVAQKRIVGGASDNAGSYVAALFTVETTGVITLTPVVNGGGWTASGVMGTLQFSFTYTLA